LLNQRFELLIIHPAPYNTEVSTKQKTTLKNENRQTKELDRKKQLNCIGVFSLFNRKI